MHATTRRREATLAILGARLLGVAPARAQEFPARPIGIVVGFCAGIGMEVSTRLGAK